VVDPDTGEATDELQPQVIKTFKEELGSNSTTVSQVIKSKDKKVFKAIEYGIKRYNKICSGIQKVLKYVCHCLLYWFYILQIQRWRVLPKDFTVSGGELG